jgi:Leucine-rich repeat (LRR) protein
LTVVNNLKEALTYIFNNEYEFFLNNPTKVKEINLEDYVFQNGVNDFELISVFKELQYLNISGTGVNNIAPIKSLNNLEILYADFCMITDLLPLSQLKYLKELDISSPLDFVNSLEPLKGLNNLEKLYVPDHPISTIKPIYNLDRLKILSIARTEVPGDEIEEFKKLHPSCEVWS